MTTTVSIGGEDVPATIADSMFKQTIGFRGRFSPPDHVMLFTWDSRQRRRLDMLGVGFSIDAGFVVDGVVAAVERARAHIGVAEGRAETLVEVPVSMDVDLEPGMEVNQ